MIWCDSFFLSHVFIYRFCALFGHMSDWHFQSSLLPTPLLYAPVHPSATTLWPRVTCSFLNSDSFIPFSFLFSFLFSPFPPHVSPLTTLLTTLFHCFFHCIVKHYFFHCLFSIVGWDDRSRLVPHQVPSHAISPMSGNKSSKDSTWSAVPDALLGVINWRRGMRAGYRPQRADVL